MAAIQHDKLWPVPGGIGAPVRTVQTTACHSNNAMCLPAGLCLLQVEALMLSTNSLSGEAFPAAWLEPDALPRLNNLDLSFNRGLMGTLPANLSWPRLEILCVPASACWVANGALQGSCFAHLSSMALAAT